LPCAVSLKTARVDGWRVHGHELDAMQDFLMVDSTAFAAKGGERFLQQLKLLRYEGQGGRKQAGVVLPAERPGVSSGSRTGRGHPAAIDGRPT